MTTEHITEVAPKFWQNRYPGRAHRRQWILHACLPPGPAMRRYALPMHRFVDQLGLVPQVAYLAARSPRNSTKAWEGYWEGVTTTGTLGQVLWDAEIGAEAEQYGAIIDASMDLTLPILDVGCGNGRWTRWLSQQFPATIGLDLSASAVDRATEESRTTRGVSFHVTDLTVPGAGSILNREYGDANVFVRGVLHVLQPRERLALGRNLLDVVGQQGRVLLTETNFRGNPLSYLHSLGARPGSIPDPLRKAISEIPVPGHFGPEERLAAFPDDLWEVLSDGPVRIATVPLNGRSTAIPGYLAMLGPR